MLSLPAKPPELDLARASTSLTVWPCTSSDVVADNVALPAMSILLLLLPVAVDLAPLIEANPPPMPSTVAVRLRIERVTIWMTLASNDTPVLMLRLVSIVAFATASTSTTLMAPPVAPEPEATDSRSPADELVRVAAPPIPENLPPVPELRSTRSWSAPLPTDVRLMPSWANRWPPNERLTVKLVLPTSGLRPPTLVIDVLRSIGVPASVWRRNWSAARLVVSAR